MKYHTDGNGGFWAEGAIMVLEAESSHDLLNIFIPGQEVAFKQGAAKAIVVAINSPEYVGNKLLVTTESLAMDSVEEIQIRDCTPILNNGAITISEKFSRDALRRCA